VKAKILATGRQTKEKKRKVPSGSNGVGKNCNNYPVEQDDLASSKFSRPAEQKKRERGGEG